MRSFIIQFAKPLQALLALGICLGMSWMIFVISSFDPSPPDVLDLQSRSTDESLSFAEMNSTAAALAFEMVSDMMPSPIVMPVTGNSTPIPLPLSSPTIAVTLRVVSGEIETTTTPFSLFSFFFEPTRTREPRVDPPTLTATQVPTRTPIPTSTPSRIPTRTPTVTRTRTPVPTDTPEPTVTPRPTATKTKTPTPVPTDAPTDPPTDTPTDVPTEEPTTLPPTQPTEDELTSTPPPIQETPEPDETGTGEALYP